MLEKEEKLKSNFVEDCIKGEALLSDINIYIDFWHNSEIDLPLFRFLGMSKKEYSLYINDESMLSYIIIAHKDNVEIENLITKNFKMAARSDNHDKSKMIERWLKKKNLWD